MGDDSFGRGINYVQCRTTASNTINESLSVEANDQTIYLTTMGTMHYGGQNDKKLSYEGAAELYWENLIRPLQERG